MASTLITSYLGQGLAAARPATPPLATGAIGYYFATDTGVLSVYANGAWRVAPPNGMDLWAPPLAASFPTIINGGTGSPAPSVTDTSYGTMLLDSGPTAVSSNFTRAALQPVPSATLFTTTVGMRITAGMNNYRVAGLCVTDGTKFETIHRGGSLGIDSAKYTNLTTFGSDNLSCPNMVGNQYYFRIQGDGTNLKFSFSANGRNFIQLYSEALGAYLGTITKVGPWALANADVTPPAVGDHLYLDVFYWANTTP